jgi:methyl coenzyme M reductase subunit C-like uncharacterized protein (methanogenesis marker protein 7)
MGVNLVNNKLEKVSPLKDLEKARQALDRKVLSNSKNEEVSDASVAPDVVYLGWMEKELEKGEESFTPVFSKMKGRKVKVEVEGSRNKTLRSSVKQLGAVNALSLVLLG